MTFTDTYSGETKHDFSQEVLDRIKLFIQRRRTPTLLPLPSFKLVEDNNGKVLAEFTDYTKLYNNLMFNAIELKEHSSAQSYGSKMESLLLNALNIPRIASKEGAADGRHPLYNTIEVKVSLSSTGEWSFQQIRSWQAAYYLLVFVHICDVKPVLEMMFVPSAVMKKITKKIGSASHSTKKENEGKEHIEMGIRLNIKDFLFNANNRRVNYKECLAELLEYSVLPR